MGDGGGGGGSGGGGGVFDVEATDKHPIRLSHSY